MLDNEMFFELDQSQLMSIDGGIGVVAVIIVAAILLVGGTYLGKAVGDHLSK